ncbi:hypothetical protein Taro_040371 [Colocasia esculenta]|uniref:CCT domain-containing protein n=1 Tax=Colocasia esculenta TaxID=4460 RepID=A0A843WIX7_COLES|nr:hypothetical protein [Colocasia esculenta]
MTAAAAASSSISVLTTQGATLFEPCPAAKSRGRRRCMRRQGCCSPTCWASPRSSSRDTTLCRRSCSAGYRLAMASSMFQGAICLQTTTVTDYDLGGEGDLFKAPEPIMEGPLVGLDHVAAAISMISSGDDVIAAEAIERAGIGSIQNEQPLSEIFYECKKDLLAKSVIEDACLELSDVKIPALQVEEQKAVQTNRVIEDGPLQKSVSSGCLTSLTWSNGGSLRPNFLDFQGMDLGAVFGMRRAYSEGDIQTLGNGSMNNVTSGIIRTPFERLSTIGDYKIEERRQKLSRYRKKKSERNFGRKIKYACRKALADSQPRVRGRFAKTEDCDIAKPYKIAH